MKRFLFIYTSVLLFFGIVGVARMIPPTYKAETADGQYTATFYTDTSLIFSTDESPVKIYTIEDLGISFFLLEDSINENKITMSISPTDPYLLDLQLAPLYKFQFDITTGEIVKGISGDFITNMRWIFVAIILIGTIVLSVKQIRPNGWKSAIIPSFLYFFVRWITGCVIAYFIAYSRSFLSAIKLIIGFTSVKRLT